MKKSVLALLLLCIAATTFAQTNKPHFNVPIASVNGDLNKDGLDDEIIVTQDTIPELKPYLLQIFFSQKDGSKKLIISSTKAIQPDEMGTGNSFQSVEINDDVMILTEQLLRGHYEHKFRFQNGHFELIGYTEVYADGIGKMYYTDFNLSTGTKIEKIENYENDKVLSNKKTKLIIRPLPKLQDFEPYEDERY